MNILHRIVILFAAINTLALPVSAQMWKAVEPENLPVKRLENAMAEANGKLYLVGGREIKSVDEYDPKKNTWVSLSQTPIEMSHFQAISFHGEVYVVGAFTGGYPHETPIPNIYIFNPVKNQWRKGPEIPENRRRGAAGAFVLNDKIYVICGIQDGHWDGQVAWFDEFDPATNTWKQLAEAPRKRDHIQVAVVDNKLYVAGGRLSTARINQVLNTTIAEVDVYDFKTSKWETLDPSNNIPTKRAGNTTVVLGHKVLFIGGESDAHVEAHNEVEAFNTHTQKWEKYPSLLQGRHGTQAVSMHKKVYIAAGSGNRGGGPELNTLEVLEN
ncbi:Kelch repeat-containing protein [Dyadobacter frigoris]|uniref:Galactose oxidase n=1 Tax=Dyadobacter frigoris TaxID=2576211 RepID=A0A4U6DD59_9BACT|nr:galactose oxidase [Dyadobacter frigoris]TKT94307.1 galactose oxidase [Dyadobacter frigoris]GLU56641.1 ring canal kelch protein [Dyadobacter frigoris]